MTSTGMTTGILNALMQLFALFAAGGNGREALWGRQAASRYLRSRLTKNISDEYLLKYDLILNKFNAVSSSGMAEKNLAKLSVKLMRTCQEINRQLDRKERLIVYARLVEFTKATNQPIDSESFLTHVADALHLPQDIIERIDGLICGNLEDSSGVMRIPVGSESEVRAVQAHDEDLFFVLWNGNEAATLNSVPFPVGLVMPFTPGSVIKSKDGETLFFSELARRLLHAQPKSPLHLEAIQLAHEFKRPATQALHPLNLRLQGGMLVGMMGASGSGKSTLLNLLNGNLTPTSGRVLLNGVDLHAEPDQVKGTIGYVAQEDVLFSELTVFENLRYAASLSFRDAEDSWLDAQTDALLGRLGLFQTRNLKVGSVLDKTISGGQRKRLNIALELIRSPRVLFVDEPTSGLSSRDSEHIMDLLKELTHRGTLVVVVIHQPSSDIFKLFDHLLILDTGGYPVYQGNPMHSLAYFKSISEEVSAHEVICSSCGHVNPEHVFNILEARMVDEWGHLTDIRKIPPSEWHAAYLASSAHAEIRDNQRDESGGLPEFKSPKWGKQFLTFLARDWRTKTANRSYLLLNLLEAPVLSGVLALFLRFHVGDSSGYSFGNSENFPQFLFISVIVALFIGLSISAEEIIRDRAVLRRERFLHLNWHAYVLSKVVMMWGWSALSAITFVVVAAEVMEIRDGLIWMVVILFSLGAFANMLGLFLSNVLNSVKVIYISIPLLIIPQIIFGGAIVRFDRFNPVFLGSRSIPWVGEMMASRWGFEALAVEFGRDNAMDAAVVNVNDRIERAAWRRDFWYRAVEGLKNPSLQSSEWKRARAELASWGYELGSTSSPESIRSAYRDAARAAFVERDSLRLALPNLTTLEAQYRNESLRDWLMQTDRTVRFREIEEGILPMGTMIHQDPEFLPAPAGGIGFYQPKKMLGSLKLSTPAYNMFVLWGMTIVLGIFISFPSWTERIRARLWQ